MLGPNLLLGRPRFLASSQTKQRHPGLGGGFAPPVPRNSILIDAETTSHGCLELARFDGVELSNIHPFKFSRTKIAQTQVGALRIAKSFGILKDLPPGLVPGRISLMMNQFSLEPSK